MLSAVWKKNDARARTLIIAASVIVFGAVVALGKVKLNVELGFDEHIFAKINAAINSTVAVLLLASVTVHTTVVVPKGSVAPSNVSRLL